MIDRGKEGEDKGRLVFLSHSTKDKELVRQVDKVILSFGFRTWLDEIAIRPGDSIRERIEQGIVDADYFMIFFSQASVQSFWSLEK